MSLYNLALIVFLAALGCSLLGWLTPVSTIVAAFAAFVCAVLLLTGNANVRL